MLDENRAHVLRATDELARQIAELKALVSRLEGPGETRRAFSKFRAQVLHPKPRAARASSRRKLPRR
jgi:hypothetical protein